MVYWTEAVVEDNRSEKRHFTFTGIRFYDGDCTLVVDVWLTKIVNSIQLCATDFDLTEVIPLQLETV